MMTKVVYFGNERLVSGLEETNAPILRGLIDHGYEVLAVVSHYSDSKSRNQRSLEVAKIAQECNIPLFTPSRPSEIIEELRDLKADIAVLVAYGRIISQEIIDIFPQGIVNVHPSLLPQYRGPTPVETVILNGDAQTGVSIMQLSAGMDSGPIYGQRALDLEGNESKFELYEKMEPLATELFFELFPAIADGSLVAKPQNDEQATYSKLIDKSDGVIDWQKPADQIEREIRAYQGWPQSRTVLGDIEVIILNAHRETGSAEPGSLQISSNHLSVGTAEGLLIIETVKPLGKKEMPVSAFLSGYRSRLKL